MMSTICVGEGSVPLVRHRFIF